MAATFIFTFGELQKTALDTSDLLRIFAFLDPENISMNILKKGINNGNFKLNAKESKSAIGTKPKRFGFTRLKEKLNTGSSRSKSIKENEMNRMEDYTDDLKFVRKLLESVVDLHKTFKHLQRLSLLVPQRDGETTRLWLHDLTQLMLRMKLVEEPERKKWLRLAIDVVCSAFDKIEDPQSPSHWTECDQYVAHMQALQRHAERYRVENTQLLDTSFWVASYLHACGRYEEAETMHRRAFKGKEKVLGPEHPDTLASVNNLGSVLESQGKYEEAEALRRQKRYIRGQT